MEDDWTRLRNALRDAAVEGVEDLGRFVGDPEHFRSSSFDERAALPVLVEYLPTLVEPEVVSAVAGHLKRPWARPLAFAALREAFIAWAHSDSTVGWSLGEALANAAELDHLQELIELATDRTYGSSRQMIVMALWRFGSDPRVSTTLIELSADPDVSLHAMGALRRVLGNEAALPHLRTLRDSHHNGRVREQAKREVAKAEKALG